MAVINIAPLPGAPTGNFKLYQLAAPFLGNLLLIALPSLPVVGIQTKVTGS